MKYLFIALIVLLCALCPYLLGKMSVSGIEERYRNACYELGINPRPFVIENGFLSSSVALDEPLSTTISSMGLAPEAVDFFRDYDLTLKIDVTHGPMHFIKSAEHAILAVSGPNWKITGEEWRTNKFKGPLERTVRIYDNALEAEGTTFCVSNFWIKDRGLSAETTADIFAFLPGFSVAGLKYSSETTEDELTSGVLTADRVLLGGAEINGLVMKVESKPVIKGGSQKSVRCEIDKGESSLGDLAGKSFEFDTKDKFFAELIGVFKDELTFENVLGGGEND